MLFKRSDCIQYEREVAIFRTHPSNMSTSVESKDAVNLCPKLSKTASRYALEESSNLLEQMNSSYFDQVENVSSLTSSESEDEAVSHISFAGEIPDSVLQCHFPSRSESGILDSNVGNYMLNENLCPLRPSLEIHLQEDNRSGYLSEDSFQVSSSSGFQNSEGLMNTKDSAGIDASLCEAQSQQPCKNLYLEQVKERCLSKKSLKRKRNVESKCPKKREKVLSYIRELRDIIPNAKKCSIDDLLSQTIRYMMFLHNLEQPLRRQSQKATKMRSAESEAPSHVCSRNGASWIVDMDIPGDERSCPITVKELYQPGQMLVEVLCEEKSFFLALANHIRSLGLNILNSTLEQRNQCMWALYIVQASKNIQRMEVSLSLDNFLGSISNKRTMPSI